MFSHFRPALSLLVVMTIITGAIYPALITVIAQTVFPFQANGSRIYVDDKLVGSELIGQQFNRPEYFWSRLSATSPTPYNAASSSGSNLGPMNPVLIDNARARIEQLRSAKDSASDTVATVPVDLVTASGSGLDPHISPAAAEFQLARVAAARNLSPEVVREQVLEHTQSRQLGVLGEPRVNVLMLNLALDHIAPQPPLSSNAQAP